MATFPLNDRHRKEDQHITRRQRKLDAIGDPISTTAATAGGDQSYRVPTIGLNSGHIPGTRPDLLEVDTVRKTWSNAP